MMGHEWRVCSAICSIHFVLGACVIVLGFQVAYREAVCDFVKQEQDCLFSAAEAAMV